MKADAHYPGTMPHLPICWMGRERCSLLGFHGHLSKQSDEERERVQTWKAWCARRDARADEHG